jgi:hypothetical protein
MLGSWSLALGTSLKWGSPGTPPPLLLYYWGQGALLGPPCWGRRSQISSDVRSPISDYVFMSEAEQAAHHHPHIAKFHSQSTNLAIRLRQPRLHEGDAGVRRGQGAFTPRPASLAQRRRRTLTMGERVTALLETSLRRTSLASKPKGTRRGWGVGRSQPSAQHSALGRYTYRQLELGARPPELVELHAPRHLRRLALSTVGPYPWKRFEAKGHVVRPQDGARGSARRRARARHGATRGPAEPGGQFKVHKLLVQQAVIIRARCEHDGLMGRRWQRGGDAIRANLRQSEAISGTQ